MTALLGTGVAVAQSSTGTLVISCTDTDNPDTCSVEGDTALLDEATLGALAGLDDCVATSDTSGICQNDAGEVVYSCSNITENSVSCTAFTGEVSTLFECTEFSDTAVSCQVSRTDEEPPVIEEPPVEEPPVEEPPVEEPPVEEPPVEEPPSQTPTEALLQFAPTPPQQELADVIGTVCPAGIVSADLQRDCNAVVGAAFGGDPSVATALSQVAPDEAGAALDASQTTLDMQSDNIRTRLSALRRGVAPALSLDGLRFEVDGQYVSARQLQELYGKDYAGGGAAADGGLDFGRLGVFVNGTFSGGDRDQTDNEAGFEFDNFGLTAGADYRLSDQAVAGLALGYQSSDLDIDNDGGSLDTDGYSLTLYGSYYPSDQLYMDASVTWGRNDYDQQRSVRYTLSDGTAVDQSAESDFDGDQFSATLGAAYELSSGSLTYGPLLRLEYIEADVEDYRESMSRPDAPGSGWALDMDEQDFESLTLTLGAQASYAISQNWGVLLPQVRVEWVSELEDDTDFIVGRFVGDPSGEAFRLPTDESDDSYFNVSLGTSAVFAQGRSAFIYYQTTLGFDDLDYYTLGAGVRLEF